MKLFHKHQWVEQGYEMREGKKVRQYYCVECGEWKGYDKKGRLKKSHGFGAGFMDYGKFTLKETI